MEETTDDKSNKVEVLTPDAILEDIGGCGRYQIRMTVIVHLIKTIICFSSNGWIIYSATPTWFCTSGPMYDNTTSCFDTNNNSASVCDDARKSCLVDNGTKCNSYTFDESFHTFTGEFNLVCGNDFIPSTINSVHIVGTLVGCLSGGQLADLYGRKPSFYASVVILMLSNLLGYFAPSWEVVAAVSFFTGVGCGIFLTIQYTILSEYSLSYCRVWMVGFPSWPLQICLLALCSYLLHDWRYIQLLIALMAVPALMTWFAIPESFRWYIGHDQTNKATKLIQKVAKFNKREENLVKLETVLRKQIHTEDNTRKYTFLHLFKTRALVKITLLLMLNWAALDIVSYGMSFGVQTLSGNIYLNLFLFALVGIPSKFIALYLQNRFGRRFSTLLCYTIISVASIIVGVIQTLEPANKDGLTNAFAFVANAGIAGAWGPLQTMTLEMYPTVIRNIGFGALGVVGKISAVVGPQLVYLNSHAPGLLFYTCGGLAVLSTLGTLLLPETKGLNLQDKFEHNHKKEEGFPEANDNNAFTTEADLSSNL